MKATLFEVLVYLLHNYMDTKVDFQLSSPTGLDEQGQEEPMPENEESPVSLLKRQGPLAMRIFTLEESQQLDTQCRNFLYKLEAMNILNDIHREQLLNHISELDINPPLSLGQLQWLVLDLFKQQLNQEDISYLEQLVKTNQEDTIH